MAYAALTSLAGVILQILPHEQRYISLCGKDQMESLHEKISLLQEFLEYISSKSFLPITDVLESRMTDIAYAMEDIIELVILTEPGTESESEVQLEAPDLFSFCFEKFQVSLEETKEMRKNLDSNAMPGKQPLTTTTLSREAASSKGTKVGLDEALNRILDQVIGQKPPLRIVPITGMGGIGKTTLARASYEAPQTLRHFDVRFWVTVSQDYNIQEILQGLLPKTEGGDERLIEYVHKHLKGRRYLIVLDDMWDEKVWDRVRNAFPDDNNGSRVILTTRSSGVASYVGSSNSLHEMQFMNEDQSWDLLREKVYGHKRCSPEFEDMGRMIATNCKGLPLAIVVIAGLLKFNKTRYYWEQVARKSDEKATTSNDHLIEILSWSYTRLPPHLKACFLYMGAYKEDYEIPTKELVRLWAAEGFLKPKNSTSMEDVAEECLEELVERSLVLVSKRRYNGKIGTCSVHDVLRELSIRKAEEEKFHYHFMPSDDESTFRNVLDVQRRVSIPEDSIDDNFPADRYYLSVSSLLNQYHYSSHYMPIIQGFKLLRVLKTLVVDYDISILCTLTNLRYLHLVLKMKEKFYASYYLLIPGNKLLIPESISELQNLETLIVHPSFETEVIFPLEIWKLQHLRHIVVKRDDSLTGEYRVPLPNHDCPNLQTLCWVTNINFTKSWAERTPNLKKLKLEVNNIYRDSESMDNLQYLHQLEELSVLGRSCYINDNFVFPQNLKKLSLYKTQIPSKNFSLVGLLPNLKMLHLQTISCEEWEPNEGEFLQLEHLKMEYLDIKHWRAESINFPRLRKLEIIKCQELEEVPESIGEIDTLETLTVDRVSDEAKRSVQRIKEVQQDMGNHTLQVTII